MAIFAAYPVPSPAMLHWWLFTSRLQLQSTFSSLISSSAQAGQCPFLCHFIGQSRSSMHMVGGGEQRGKEEMKEGCLVWICAFFVLSRLPGTEWLLSKCLLDLTQFFQRPGSKMYALNSYHISELCHAAYISPNLFLTINLRVVYIIPISHLRK